MFKKADKHELRTWLIGDLFITICTLVASISLIGGAFTQEFRVGRFIWGIVFAGLSALCILFLVKIISSLKTYDARQKDKDEKEAQEKALKEESEREKLEQEALEMEALREQELQKREEMKIKLEQERAEKEAKGESYGEDNE